MPRLVNFSRSLHCVDRSEPLCVKLGQKGSLKKALARLRGGLDGRDLVAKTAAMLEGIFQRQEY
jgi:hypothetical protein